MDSLNELRKQIDDTDRQIVELLDKRAAIAKQVGAAKQGGPVYRPEREKQVLDQAAKNSQVMPEPAVRAIYREIISACRNIQIS